MGRRREGGYQVGNFPVRWAEWNGKYRDAMRAFWRGRAPAGELGYRLTGSSDLYENDGRRPYSSVNFVTAHDGFTLRDLVSYNDKHNEANGEDNRDGTDDNASWNCGAEGPDGRRRRSCALRAATDAQPPGDAAPLARDADDLAAATRSAGRSAGTTTRTARTTRSAGTTGSSTTSAGASSPSRSSSSRSVRPIRRCVARSSSRGAGSAARTCATSCGSASTGGR